MTQREDLMNNKNAFQWLKKPQAIKTYIETVVTDVLVIGAGHAGIAAARSAIETNPDLSVLVVEQQNEEGFRILGSGEVGHINSKWQEKYQIAKVEIEAFVNDWQLRSNNRSNYGLIKRYAENSGDCFDWMIEVLDHEEINQIYPVLENPSHHMPKSLNGFQAYVGTAKMPIKIQNSMMRKNKILAQTKGVEFRFNHKAYDLITEGERIVGAILQGEDGFIKVNVRNAVILAAGDYSKNAQMCRDLLTEAADLIDQDSYWLGQGWQGDGLKLGMLAGGRMEARSHPAVGGNFAFPGFEVIGSSAVLRVNKHGKRYSNEAFGTHILATLAGAKQANGMLYGIFDSHIMEQIEAQTNSHVVFDYCVEERLDKLGSDLKRAEQAGPEGTPISAVLGNENPNMPRRLYSGETLEILSEYIYEDKADRLQFLKTVRRYNKICHQGRDVDFGKDSSQLIAIEAGPYYAVGQLKDSHRPMGQSYKLLVTIGGLMIDDHQRVLNDAYEPLEGLYATGNTSGCRFGHQYSPSIAGQGISVAHTLGREVGRYIATNGGKKYE